MQLMYQGVTLSKLFIGSDTEGDWQAVTGQIGRSQAHRDAWQPLMHEKLDGSLWRGLWWAWSAGGNRQGFTTL